MGTPCLSGPRRWPTPQPRGVIVYTNEPKLQALLGRDRVAPSTWREPHSATQGPSAIFNTPLPTVPAVNIGAVKHEPVTTAYGRTTLERLDTVRATPYTNAPTSYRFSTQARDMEELPAPDRNSSGKQPTMLAEGIDEPDNKQQIIISQIIRGYPEKNMYSGADDSMSLQYRLNAFHMNCTNMGLDMRYVMRVFPSMLTGEASHHFTSVSKPGLSWQDAVDLLAAKYETESQQRLREDEWRLITLASVCNDEQGVYLPVSRNLIRLCSILSLKQRSLSVFFQGEYYLRPRFYDACRTHPNVLDRVKILGGMHSTVEELAAAVSETQSGLPGDAPLKKRIGTAKEGLTADAHMVERIYHGNKPRFRSNGARPCGRQPLKPPWRSRSFSSVERRLGDRSEFRSRQRRAPRLCCAYRRVS
ncbi:hypothetical protein SEPCBS57363_000494 [Sporothrix epigloea]|uniref:Uncharacterized protein n=1 Tax=Sporothrix epigloea TaxID=1892477 RepID=A0ABP0D513_9PEZI